MSLFSGSSSPAVTVREIDLTGVSPNVETSIAGMVGDFSWGPVEQPTRITNEGQLATVFGTPKADKAVDYLSASAFLRYSGNLIVTRVIEETNTPGQDSCVNATSGTNNILVKNSTDYDAKRSSLSSGDFGKWIAKYPSSLGNSLAVSIFAYDGVDSDYNPITKFQTWDYRNEFSAPPDTSEWAERQGTDIEYDEAHVVVIDEDGAISGTKGTVLEVFPFVSLARGAKTNDGSTNFMPEVINRTSSFIRFGGFDSGSGTWWGVEPTGTYIDYSEGYSWSNSTATESLTGGADSLTLTQSTFLGGFDLYEDPDTVDLQILIAPGMTDVSPHVTIVNDLVATARGIRKDCVVVTSPNRSAVVNNNNPVVETILTTDEFTPSNYLIVDNNYLKVYDKFNDQFVFIPAASSTAGILAATDANFGPWYSPAGQRRGLYLGITALAYSPLKTDRDTLYKAGINPIVQLPGQGTLLFGDKTKEVRPSAFDRINVRRLFLAIEKSISLAARNVLFEFNDEFVRAEFVGIIEPVLREIQARRGIQEFFVQCDDTNNTPAVIDRNELVATIFVKPARSINFVTLNFVAVRTGVAFEEIVGNI